MSELYEDQEQQPQQPNGVNNYPFYNPYLNDQNNSDLVRMALTTTDLIDDLRMNLLGYEYDEKSEKFISSKKARPLINEEGANKIIIIISSFVNRNSTVSNLTEDDILKMCKEVEHVVNDHFFDKWKDYWHDQWEAEANWRIIRPMVGNYANICLRRAKDGREMSILGGGQKTFTQIQRLDSSQRITQNPSQRWGFK